MLSHVIVIRKTMGEMQPETTCLLYVALFALLSVCLCDFDCTSSSLATLEAIK